MVGATPIVLVSGPPASGKSYVCDVVAGRVGIPVIAKDAVKEALFDSLGTGDLAWSRRLGFASFAVMFRVLEAELRARRPVLLEGNFEPEGARRELARLRERHDFAVLELHCTAPSEVLVERYAARSGSRHPGHLDEVRVGGVGAAVGAGRNGPVGAGRLIVVDTTSVPAVDTAALAGAVAAHLAAPA